ncbi:MAG: hypothetical protein JXL80_02900 [Planctomycetes bacterium]|nr:hypothetical protein [Planctomycetota bacterium]
MTQHTTLSATEVDCVVDGAECVVFDFHLTLCSELFFTALGESAMAGVQQFLFGHDQALADRWMLGEATASQVAQYLSERIGLAASEIEAGLRQGCREFVLNEAVWGFARSAHAAGKRTALVTVNADVFSEEIAPSHGLDRVFDIIVNSADHGTTDKRRLWPVAFEALGDAIGYAGSFLIEDGEQSPSQFIEAGGKAYQYRDDAAFTAWIRERCG